MKLHEELNHLTRYPFHMPGHKRNAKFGITGSEIDITEIDGFDNLHRPTGILLELEQRLQQHYKSKRSFLLTGGSTLGILAAVFAVCNEGDTVIIARNCHKSVYNACLLRHLRVVYLEPQFDFVNCCYTSITQEAVKKITREHPEAAALIITSPTYEGRLSNIRCEIPLIVDAAHGAHLGISCFPAYPRGSIVVSSLHKTLPALTQTAVLNIYDRTYIDKAKRYLDLLGTSSPSYVLMNSVSVCCDVMEDESLFRSYYKMLTDFRQINLYALRLKYSDDISKIVISTENTALSGSELAAILREQYALECEMASRNYIVLMTSVGDEQEAFDRLRSALTEIDGTLMQKAEPIHHKPPTPQGGCVIAYPERCEATELRFAAGKTAGEFVYTYPPDIPVIVPGEVIEKETLTYLVSLQESGVHILSDSGLLPEKILTKAAD